MSNSDYEEEDVVQDESFLSFPPNANQKFVLMSFISPDGTFEGNKGDMHAFIVHGVFSQKDKAVEHIEHVRNKRTNFKYFDFFIAPVGYWKAWLTKEVAAQIPVKYAEKQLNELLSKTKASEEHKTREFKNDINERISKARFDATSESQNFFASLHYKAKTYADLRDHCNNMKQELLNEIDEKDFDDFLLKSVEAVKERDDEYFRQLNESNP